MVKTFAFQRFWCVCDYPKSNNTNNISTVSSFLLQHSLKTIGGYARRSANLQTARIQRIHITSIHKFQSQSVTNHGLSFKQEWKIGSLNWKSMCFHPTHTKFSFLSFLKYFFKFPMFTYLWVRSKVSSP